MPQLQMVAQRFQTNRWQWTVCHFVFALATHQKESQKQIKARGETETCMVVLMENKAACKIEWRCRWTSQMACFKGQRWSTFYKISSKFAGKAFQIYSINIIGEVSIFPGGQIVLQPEVKICKMYKGQLTEKFPNLLSATVPMWYLFLLIS